jgi:hypothetical protein
MQEDDPTGKNDPVWQRFLGNISMRCGFERAQGMIDEARNIVLMLGEEFFGPPGADVRAALERSGNLFWFEGMILNIRQVKDWQELLQSGGGP